MLLLNIIFGVILLPFLGFIIEHFIFGRDIAAMDYANIYLYEKLGMSKSTANSINKVTRYFLLSWALIYLFTYVFVEKLDMNIWLFAGIITIVFFIVECFVIPNLDRQKFGFKQKPICAKEWTARVPGCKCQTGVLLILAVYFGVVGGYKISDKLGLI